MAAMSIDGSSDHQKRAAHLLSFAAKVKSELPEIVRTNRGNNIRNDVARNLASIPTSSTAVPAFAGELDRNGTELWNICTRLKHEVKQPELSATTSSPPSHITTILSARVFAFLMMDYARIGGIDNYANTIRLMKTSFVAAKECLKNDEVDLARKLLEKSALYEEIINQIDVAQLRPEQYAMNIDMNMEYLILRIYLAWKDGNVEVAEHMFNKASKFHQINGLKTVQSFADLLCEIGSTFLHDDVPTLATLWLERALVFSINGETDHAFLLPNAHRNLEGAQHLLDSLPSGFDDRPIVQLLKPRITSASLSALVGDTTYRDYLENVMESVILSDLHLKVILFHIQKIYCGSSSEGCRLMEKLISDRLVKENKPQWIDLAISWGFSMNQNSRDDSTTVEALSKVLSSIYSSSIKTIGRKATSLIQQLVWKRLEYCCNHKQYQQGREWCGLMLHPAFDNAFERNISKCYRKLLLGTLSENDTNSARDIFAHMPQKHKNEPLTRFLLYKLAVITNNTELATECLTILTMASDHRLMYGCFLEAKKADERVQIITASERMIDKLGFSIIPEGMNLLVLLRTTIRMLMSQIADDENHEGVVGKQICKLFNFGLSYAKKQRISVSGKAFSLPELEWFSKNAYNIALQYRVYWKTDNISELLRHCIAFIDLILIDKEAQCSDDLVLRRLLCDFFNAHLEVTAARSDTDFECQLQHYLTCRKHVASFNSIYQSRSDKIETVIKQDLLKKQAVILTYDFEAAVKLKSSDELAIVALKARDCHDLKTYEAFVSCLLGSDLQPQVIIVTLKKIINEVWLLGAFSTPTLSRYMRCLFQLALSHAANTRQARVVSIDQPQNDIASNIAVDERIGIPDLLVAEDLLDQINNLASNAYTSDQPYPAEELEWIVTTSFNFALDLFANGIDLASKRWAKKSILLAGYCPDDEQLKSILDSKFSGLRWD